MGHYELCSFVLAAVTVQIPIDQTTNITHYMGRQITCYIGELHIVPLLHIRVDVIQRKF